MAVLPVACVLVLMVGARWSAARSGLVGFVVAVAVAITAFDFGGAEDPFGIPAGLVGVAFEATFIAATILVIIGPALGVHHLNQRTGASADLQDGLGRITPDPRVAALLVAWFFGLFLEGAAGFGTPVALAAPFLASLGFKPVAAVTAALVGHAVGVSFGAVGTPVLAMATRSGLDATDLGAATARYHLVLGGLLVAALVAIVTRAMPGPVPWRAGIVAAVTFLVPLWLIAEFIGPELPTIGAAVVGVLSFLALRALMQRREVLAGTPLTDETSEETTDRVDPRRQLRAGAPYLVLVGLVLVTRLVPFIDDAFSDVVVSWQFAGAFSGEMEPLNNPGVLLAVAFGAGALIQRASGGDVRDAVGETTGQLRGVAVALVAMVGIATLMTVSGMTEELAAAAADTGAWWPVFAPVVGGLGTFITGSATASNILFTDLQVATAETLDQPVVPLLGAQGFGAAVGNIVCPHNIVAAAATVRLVGDEGAVLRRTLPVAIGYVAAGGALAWWFVT